MNHHSNQLLNKAIQSLKTTPLGRWVNLFITPSGTLKQKAIKGSGWVLLRQASSWILWFVRIVVLARLLSPQEFGLFGIAFLVSNALEAFSQTGFQAALIQKKDDVKPYLDVVWTVQVLRGVAIALILIASASTIATFFQEPLATLLIQVLALSPLFMGLNNIGIVYFEKDLEFHKQVLFQLSGSIVDLVVAVSIALVIGNVWALVWGLIANRLTQAFVSYFIHPYRPTFRLEYQKIKELYSYGKWVFGSSVILAFSSSGINTLVAKILGTTSLGFYRMANQISLLIFQEIDYLFQQVSFPVYAKIQDQLQKLQIAYLKVLQAVAFIAFPITMGIIALAPQFINIFLGEVWLPITRTIQLLACVSLIGTLHGTARPLFKAIGRPDLWTKLASSWVLILTILIYPLSKMWDIEGVALALLISAIPITIIGLNLAMKTISGSVVAMAKILSLPAISSLIMLSVILIFKIFVFQTIGLLSFSILVIGGVLSYIGSLYVLAKMFNQPLFFDI